MSMRKSFTLLLVLTLAVSSLMAIKLAQAYITKPEFTLKLVAHPYDVSTTYGIDPFTGKNVTIQEGYHARNESIVITIKNQPITNLFYNVRYKGHFGESWTELYSYSYAFPESLGNSPGSLIPQSNSGYTVITISESDFTSVFDGATIDFQVQVLSWVYVDVWVSDHPMAPPPINEIGHYEQRFILGETGGWSSTQTMTFAAILPSVTLLSPQEKNYSTSEVPLTFKVDRQFSQIKYYLDGKANVTIVGNTTLTGLSNGLHNITVYAWDPEGNGASETVYFTVAQQSEPFPTTWIVAAIAIMAIGAAAGYLIYKRRK
jgi:hypothetical protein